jgi:hypothetical protein
MRLAITLLTRDEIDIIKPWFDFHAHRADLLIVTDNGSIDGTREFLDARKSENCAVLHEDGSTWEQRTWVNRMAALAAERGCDWCFHSDADEFWRGDLRTAITTTKGNAIFVPSFRYPSTFRDNLNETNPIKRLVRRTAQPLFIWQKVIHQTSGFLTVVDGNHDVTFKPDIVKSAEDSKTLAIAHFNERSFEHFRRRFVCDGKVLTLGVIPENRSWHVRRVYQAYEAGGVAALRDIWVDRLAGYEDTENGLVSPCRDLVIDPILENANPPVPEVAVLEPSKPVLTTPSVPTVVVSKQSKPVSAALPTPIVIVSESSKPVLTVKPLASKLPQQLVIANKTSVGRNVIPRALRWRGRKK